MVRKLMIHFITSHTSKSSKSSKSSKMGWTLVTIAVFTLCLSFSVKYAFFTPYVGMALRWTEGAWVVQAIDECTEPPCNQGLKSGDRVIQVGDLHIGDAWPDLIYPFQDAIPGEPVTLILDSGNSVDWVIPETHLMQKLGGLASFLFVLPFWGSGVVVTRYVRPFTTKWAIAASHFYLYAIFVSSGMVSAVVDTQFVMRVSAWMLLPLTIHVHMLFPRTLSIKKKMVLYAGYSIGVTLAFSDALSLLPQRTFYISFLIQIAASIWLLVQQMRDGRARSEAAIMFSSLILAFSPGIFWWLIYTVPQPAPHNAIIAFTALTSLSLWPIIYTYAIAREFIVELESKLRESLVLLSYLIIYLNVAIFMSSVVAKNAQWSSNQLSQSWVWLVVLSILAVVLYRLHRRFLTHLLYGDLDERIEKAQAIFSHNMPSMSNQDDMIKMLNQIAGILHLQETAVYIADVMGNFRKQLTIGVNAPEKLTSSTTFEWSALNLPFQVQQKVWGWWYIGSRRSSAFYSSQHAEKLQNLANSIAATIIIQQQHRALHAQTDRLIEQEKLAAIARQAGSLAHQFNNPLQIVSGSLQAAVRYPEDDKAPKWIQMAQTQVIYLTDLVRSITRQVRPTKNALALIDVNESVREALLLSRQRIHDSQTDVSLDLSAGVPNVEMMHSDLTQVVTNLVDNACDAMMTMGERTLRVKTHSQNGHVYVSVKDTGVGISDYQRRFLFEPFYTSKENGTGFGLLIVYSIIERGGGEIFVESAPGWGSEFLVKIPAVKEG